MVKSFIFSMLFSVGVFAFDSPPISEDLMSNIISLPDRANRALETALTRCDALDWAQECLDSNVYLYYVPSLPVCRNFPEYYQGTQKYTPKLHRLAARFYFVAYHQEGGVSEDLWNAFYYFASSYFLEQEQQYLTE